MLIVAERELTMVAAAASTATENKVLQEPLAHFYFSVGGDNIVRPDDVSCAGGEGGGRQKEVLRRNRIISYQELLLSSYKKRRTFVAGGRTNQKWIFGNVGRFPVILRGSTSQKKPCLNTMCV